MNVPAIQHILADLFNPLLTLLWLTLLWNTPLSAAHKKRHLAATLLGIAANYIVSHLNRWFLFWPAEPYFTSGHMSYAATLAVSIYFLRGKVALWLAPLLLGYGWVIVQLFYHKWLDILGALAIAPIVAWLCHRLIEKVVTETSARAT